MPEFWLGTCDLKDTATATGSMAEPLLAHDLRWLAVEVIRIARHPGAAPDDFAVMLAGADGNDPPDVLDCRIGFTNSARACLAWRDRNCHSSTRSDGLSFISTASGKCSARSVKR